MGKTWVYVLLVIICVMQILILVKISNLEKELDNAANYLSEKIDNETSKVNEILINHSEGNVDDWKVRTK